MNREVWEAAQKRLAQNRANLRGKPKNEYLLSRRVACGACGRKMVGLCSKVGKKQTKYLYYRCNANSNRDYATRCDLSTLFRADHVDAAVWQWVKSLLDNPMRLEKGLDDYRAERNRENEPFQARLTAVKTLIADNQEQLERLLDLYLAGDFPKEMLTERKTRLESTINALEEERTVLDASLESHTLTEEQIRSIKGFAAKVREGLEIADFQTRRRIIETLDVKVTLTVEEKEKVVYIQCVLDDSFENCIALQPLTSNKGGNTQKVIS